MTFILQFSTIYPVTRKNTRDEGCQWQSAREPTLEAMLQRRGDGVAERDGEIGMSEVTETKSTYN